MKQSTNHSSDIHTSHSKQDDETSNNLYGIESGMSVEFIVLPGAGSRVVWTAALHGEHIDAGTAQTAACNVL